MAPAAVSALADRAARIARTEANQAAPEGDLDRYPPGPSDTRGIPPPDYADWRDWRRPSRGQDPATRSAQEIAMDSCIEECFAESAKEAAEKGDEPPARRARLQHEPPHLSVDSDHLGDFGPGSRRVPSVAAAV